MLKNPSKYLVSTRLTLPKSQGKTVAAHLCRAQSGGGVRERSSEASRLPTYRLQLPSFCSRKGLVSRRRSIIFCVKSKSFVLRNEKIKQNVARCSFVQHCCLSTADQAPTAQITMLTREGHENLVPTLAKNNRRLDQL